VPVLGYRGLLDRFAAQATWAGPVPRFSFGPLQLDFSGLPVSPLHVLAIPQRRLEELLAERLAELGGTIRRGHELTALSQHDDAVTVDVRSPAGDYRLRARYLVGCDGAHSLVRKRSGIGFPGITSSEVASIGRVFLPTAKTGSWCPICGWKPAMAACEPPTSCGRPGACCWTSPAAPQPPMRPRAGPARSP
jgi:2-polyprenyl-6-methoxyphenol hydroxylase-like FAD-dependent oxidoreductase